MRTERLIERGVLKEKPALEWVSKPPAKSSSPVRQHWLERKILLSNKSAGRTLSFSHGTALSASASPRASRTQQCSREILIYALHTHLSSCRSISVPQGSLMSPVLTQGRALSCTFDRLRPQLWAGEETCPRLLWNLADQEPETLQAPTRCLIFVKGSTGA